MSIIFILFYFILVEKKFTPFSPLELNRRHQPFIGRVYMLFKMLNNFIIFYDFLIALLMLKFN